MAEEKTETSSKKQKTKSRAFYYIDGFLIRLLLIVVLIALLWNWDGFWKTDIKVLKQAQEKYFPIKYKAESLKTSVINENLEIVQQMKERTSKYKEETKKALQDVEAAEAKVIAITKKGEVLLRYYDTSRRIIDKLKRKFSPDELDAALKCNSIECEEIVKSSAKAAPETHSFK
ncbi:MAG: hypothetical protein ABFR31_02770 [Thermodesulfobacteriota bacterium]